MPCEADFFRSQSTPTSAVHFATASTSDSIVISGFVHVTNRCINNNIVIIHYFCDSALLILAVCSVACSVSAVLCNGRCLQTSE